MSAPADLADVAELAAAMGQTRQAIQARAKREQWPYQQEPRPFGQPKRLYALDSMPEKIAFLVRYTRRDPLAIKNEKRIAWLAVLAMRDKLASLDRSAKAIQMNRENLAAELAAALLGEFRRL